MVEATQVLGQWACSSCGSTHKSEEAANFCCSEEEWETPEEVDVDFFEEEV